MEGFKKIGMRQPHPKKHRKFDKCIRPKVHLDKSSRCNFGVSTSEVDFGQLGVPKGVGQVENPKTKVISIEYMQPTTLP